jgi:hypothetical protein
MAAAAYTHRRVLARKAKVFSPAPLAQWLVVSCRQHNVTHNSITEHIAVTGCYRHICCHRCTRQIHSTGCNGNEHRHVLAFQVAVLLQLASNQIQLTLLHAVKLARCIMRMLLLLHACMHACMALLTTLAASAGLHCSSQRLR